MYIKVLVIFFTVDNRQCEAQVKGHAGDDLIPWLDDSFLLIS